MCSTVGSMLAVVTMTSLNLLILNVIRTFSPSNATLSFFLLVALTLARSVSFHSSGFCDTFLVNPPCVRSPINKFRVDNVCCRLLFLSWHILKLIGILPPDKQWKINRSGLVDLSLFSLVAFTAQTVHTF
jgi:hypothetical protein